MGELGATVGSAEGEEVSPVLVGSSVGSPNGGIVGSNVTSSECFVGGGVGLGTGNTFSSVGSDFMDGADDGMVAVSSIAAT